MDDDIRHVKVRFEDEDLTVQEMADRLAEFKRRGTLRGLYDSILGLQAQLYAEVLRDAARELLQSPSRRSGPDNRKINALSATYELQEYLANAIAAAVSSGELEPDPDD